MKSFFLKFVILVDISLLFLYDISIGNDTGLHRLIVPVFMLSGCSEGRDAADRGKAMKIKKLVSLLLLTVLFTCLAAPALAATYATVVGGWLRLRAEPSYLAETITSYKTGSVVTVLSDDGTWCKVKTSDYRVGYMDRRYLSFNATPTPSRTWADINENAWITSPNGNGVRLRNAPKVDSTNVLGLYPVGRTVYVYKQSSDGWSYIRIDRKYGYMMSKFLSNSRIDPTGTIPLDAPSDEMIPVFPTVLEPIPTTGDVLQSMSLNNTSPRVGDLLQISVTPVTATYQVIWFRDDNQLLSNTTSYRVQSGDAGHIIYVHVSGTGASSGVNLDRSTDIVGAALR